MDRRRFSSGVAFGLLAAPFATGAQQARKVYRIGNLRAVDQVRAIDQPQDGEDARYRDPAVASVTRGSGDSMMEPVTGPDCLKDRRLTGATAIIASHRAGCAPMRAQTNQRYIMCSPHRRAWRKM